MYIYHCLLSVKLDCLSFAICAIEVCTVSLETNEGLYIIMGIYRPHADSFENFFVEYEALLNSVELTGKKCLITGDFNLNLLQCSRVGEWYANLMLSRNFFQIITKPTIIPVIEGHDPSLLVHLWINDPVALNSGIILNDLTDHLPIFIQIPMPNSNIESDNIKLNFREKSNENYLKLKNSLISFDWEGI